MKNCKKIPDDNISSISKYQRKSIEEKSLFDCFSKKIKDIANEISSVFSVNNTEIPRNKRNSMKETYSSDFDIISRTKRLVKANIESNIE